MSRSRLTGAPAIRHCTRPSSAASFFSGMARCAALYFRKKRSHAPGPTTIIAKSAGGAFIEGSKAQRAQHASSRQAGSRHDREKCAVCRPRSVPDRASRPCVVPVSVETRSGRRTHRLRRFRRENLHRTCTASCPQEPLARQTPPRIPEKSPARSRVFR